MVKARLKARSKPKAKAEERDPFHVDPTIIPKNKGYQWIAIEIHGEAKCAPQFVGWKPVPFKRHAKLFPKMNVRGKIVWRGQMLMERPLKEITKAIETGIKAARDMDKVSALQDYPYLIGQVANRSVYPKFNSVVIPNEPYWTQEGIPTEMVVEVKVKLRLTAKQVDAAAACKLTPEHYAQNAVSMLSEGRFDALLLPTWLGYYEIFDRFPIFERTR